MNGIIEGLNAASFDVCRVSLSVHSKENFRKDKRKMEQRWLDNLSTAHSECLRRRPDLPVYAVGYSLGGLVTLGFINEQPTALERLVLLAPALAFTPSTGIIRLIAYTGGGTNIALPSFAPRSSRARDMTPLAEYAGMFRLAHSISKAVRSGQLDKIPTLVLMDPKDELVSYRDLQQWVVQNRLNNWKLIPVEVSDAAQYRHLIVVEDSLGAEGWRAFTAEIAQYLIG